MRKSKTSKKVMLINAQHPEECRAVVLDNNVIQDYIVEHSSREQIKGNVYLGVINRVEPSIEAAFVDFGGKKFGFLPFKDVLKESYVHTGEKKAKVRIQDVLIRGQRILVQVAKESRDAKGPSLTNAMSLAGRFLVLMQGHGSAVSRKIEDESERKKLKDIVADFNLPENLGIIIRTAGLGQTKVELQKDVQMLLKIWNKIEDGRKNESESAPFLIYQEPGLVVRTVRDHFSSDTSQIIVDNSDSYKDLKDFVKLVMPRNRNLVKFYKETKPLFSEYHVEEQIESIYQRKVLLPSGGSIVIDIGEAMVSIDVNSGKTKGGLDLEETAVTTNLEAATEVARQLRLRDLGGLIVIDFIDMFQKRNKAAVEKEVKQACKNDKARINLARISKFGLLEMSRQRISPPVKEGVFVQCGQCEGTGLVRSMDSIILNVLRKIHETIAKEKVKILSLEVSPAVSNYFLNHKLSVLAELKSKHSVDFRFQITQGLSYENFKYIVSEVWESEVVTETKPTEKPGATVESKESAEPPIKAEASQPDTEKSEPGNTKPNAKRRYTRRKPVARKGPPRGRRRRPSQNSKPAEGAPGEKATAEPKGEVSLGNSVAPSVPPKDNSPTDINLPMPPMPMPYVRKGQSVGGEPPLSSKPLKDGAGD
ncbi:MAG: Rne/Rng family ribonuclease [Nitrospina sp.]|jgi:ribonuclease E|nr:Rne/Rng family ribonuclease [Nitrospina sp.]